jgi:hypothetical protein
MNVDGRKGLFAIAATLALTLAALIYFLFVVHAPEEKQTSSAAGSQASTLRAIPQLLVAPPPPITADETDVCGDGRINQDAVEDIRAEARKTADKTFSRLKAKLAASRDPREMAMGLYLQGSTDTLVNLAFGSRDPQVYATAFLSCHYGLYGGSENCALLSARQWADIEPDNAVPWLLIASATYNVVTRDEAIYRASAAQRFAPRFPDFLGMFQLPDIRGQAPQTRSVLEEDLFAMHLTLPTLPYSTFFKFCNFPAVADARHIDVCNNLAKLFLEKDSTMIGLGVAVKLAQSADWSPDVVNALRQKKTAYQEALRKAVSLPIEKPHSDCEEQAKFEHWAEDYARLGDRGVAMKFIEETDSPADAVRRRQ